VPAMIDCHERSGGFVVANREGATWWLADDWSRATTRQGLRTVTNGPAVTNTFTALTAARTGGAVLLVTGDTPGGVVTYDSVLFRTTPLPRGLNSLPSRARTGNQPVTVARPTESTPRSRRPVSLAHAA
jgi:hypothetical protein